MMKRVKGVARGIAYFLLSVIGILLIVFILLNTRTVQRLVIGKVTERLSDDIGADIRIRDIDISFFDSVILKEVYISDRNKDTLLFSEKIAAEFSLNRIFDQEITIKDVSARGSYLNLYRSQGSENFNYSFILEEFASNDTTTTPWNIILEDAALKNIRLDFFDYQIGMRINGQLSQALATIQQLGAEDQATIIDQVKIAGLKLKIENNVVPLPDQPAAELAFEEENESKNQHVFINLAEIRDSEFLLNNHKTGFSEGIDWNHLWVKNINGKLDNIELSKEGYAGVIRSFSLQERSGFELNNLTAAIEAKLPSLRVNLKELSTPRSQIEEQLTVYFPDLENFEDNLKNIGAVANLKNTYLATRDLEYFLPDLDTIPQLKGRRVYLAGQVKGELADFSAKDLIVSLSEANELKGDFRIKGILEPQKAYYYAHLDYLETTADFISEFLKKEPEGVNLNALGNLQIKGSVAGKLNNLSVNALLKSSAGIVLADMKLSINEEFNLTNADGAIKATGAQLGKILRNNQLGSITASAKIQKNGERITVPQGIVQSFRFNNYTYKDILLSGLYENEFIKAYVKSNDVSLNGGFTANVNLKGKPEYNLNGHFNNVNLQKLNFTEDPLTLAGEISGSASGSEVDKIEGKLLARSFTIDNEKHQYHIDSLLVQTQLQKDLRSLSARSDFFNVDLKGRFNFSELPAAALHLVNHYYSGIKSPGDKHLKSLDFTASLEDNKGLLRLVVPGLEDLQGLKIDGSWEKETHKLNTNLQIDKLVYQGTRLDKIKAEITAGEEKLKIEATANQLGLTENIKFQQTFVEGELKNDSLLFTTQFTDSASSTHLDLDGILALAKDSLKLTIPDAQIALKGNEWYLEGSPKLVFSDNYLSIKNFLLTAQPNQQILINSKNLKKQGPSIFTEIKNVHLDEITELAGLSFPISGTINGTARITDPLNTPSIHGTITADSLSAKGELLGSGVILLEKEQKSPSLVVDARLTEKERLLAVKGAINIEGPENELDLRVTAEQLALSTIEPFASEFAYELEGTATADLKVSGTIQAPEVLGVVNLTGKNLIGLEATKTSYIIRDESFRFTNNQIVFDSLQIFDTKGNIANVFGNVYHSQLSNFRFDLDLSASNFLFLNNEEQTVVPFYGEIYADMKMQVNGPADSLNVLVNVVAEKKSNIFMSLEVPESNYATPEFIRFIDGDSVRFEKKITSAAKAIPDTAEYSLAFQSFNIEGTIEINKDAVFNLIVDPVNGDKITARGEGEFQFSFDTKNDLNLFGNYILSQGNYTFTFLNLVKKNFDIVKGSSISWQGDPLRGTMDVTASYTTETSRSPLIQDQASLNPDEMRAARKELPVTVLLFLEGELMSPDITFDIKTPETTEGFTGSLVASRISQIKANPSELNKQVLGLIAFNQFMPYESWEISGGAGTGAIAAQSVSRALNSQLNNLTQQIGGFDLDVNVKAGDELSLDALNIMASKQINERLSVSVGGDVTQTRASDGGTMFIGDYIVYYQLSKGGNVSLKIFSESDMDLYTDYVQQVTGVSIRHYKSFSNFKEIF